MELNNLFDFFNNLSEIIISHKVLLIDIIGYVAIVLSVLGFLSKSTNMMRFHGMTSTLLFGISIYFYNGINGLFVSLISFITKTLSIFIEEEKLDFIKFISPIIAFICFYFFNNEGMIGILPAISLIFIMIADIQKDILNMKLIYFGSAISWLFYGIALGSIPAILFDVFGIITLTYSVLKIKKERLKELKNKI